MPSASWPPPTEWPKLDLPKRRLIRLALVWTVPYTPWAEEQFGELLDDSGSMIAVFAYTRSKTLHYRLETARRSPEGDTLQVTVQYRCDTEGLPPVPKSLHEPAWLLEPLLEVRVEGAVQCHADFTFADSDRLKMAIHLPFPAASLTDAYAVDEIRGIRGIKHDDDRFGFAGYAFTLDRLASGDIALSVDFVQEAGPPYEAAEAALGNAEFIARGLVRLAPRKPRSTKEPPVGEEPRAPEQRDGGSERESVTR
jgi:hypothetical protein